MLDWIVSTSSDIIYFGSITGKKTTHTFWQHNIYFREAQQATSLKNTLCEGKHVYNQSFFALPFFTPSKMKAWLCICIL